MKTSTWLLLGATGYGVYYLSQLGVATGTVRVVFDGIEIRGITNYVVTMAIQNVSNIAVNVNSMSGDIILNGNHLASMSGFNPVKVPANGEVKIPINVSPDILSLPSTIKNFIQNGLGTLNFTIVGDVNVNGLVLPFDLDKSISL